MGDAVVTIVRVSTNGNVRLGIDAPRDVEIVRSELEENTERCSSDGAGVQVSDRI